jgi:hypothetical protein
MHEEENERVRRCDVGAVRTEMQAAGKRCRRKALRVRGDRSVLWLRSHEIRAE